MTASPAKAVLVVNAGSSSLKVKLVPQGLSVLAERLGTPRAGLSGNFFEAAPGAFADHEQALTACLTLLSEQLSLASLAAVGHRVVHGGERYTLPTLLDAAVIKGLEALSPLAPLHNPANLEGIRAAMALLPLTPQVAVFDTAFHATLPPQAYLYGLPRRFCGEGLRRYGFHGASHDFVTRAAARVLGRPRQELKLISLHLGNGASAAAVAHGRSVDTTMGLTPLEGLLMGTRPGDIDPGVLLYLLREGMSLAALDRLLNQESGLLGLSGVSNDMRDVRAAALSGHEAAGEALAVFVYRLRKTVGAYAAAMGGLDGVIFTGGIGENDAQTREEAVAGLAFLGLELAPERNRKHETVISRDLSRVKILVIKTDEERMIAEGALAALGEKVVYEDAGY